jgi:hypothetical protein
MDRAEERGERLHDAPRRRGRRDQERHRRPLRNRDASDSRHAIGLVAPEKIEKVAIQRDHVDFARAQRIERLHRRAERAAHLGEEGRPRGGDETREMRARRVESRLRIGRHPSEAMPERLLERGPAARLAHQELAAVARSMLVLRRGWDRRGDRLHAAPSARRASRT